MVRWVGNNNSMVCFMVARGGFLACWSRICICAVYHTVVSSYSYKSYIIYYVGVCHLTYCSGYATEPIYNLLKSAINHYLLFSWPNDQTETTIRKHLISSIHWEYIQPLNRQFCQSPQLGRGFECQQGGQNRRQLEHFEALVIAPIKVTS